MSAGLESLMVTRGRTAPLLSVTVPLMAPVPTPTFWPRAARGSTHVTASSDSRTRRLIDRRDEHSAINMPRPRNRTPDEAPEGTRDGAVPCVSVYSRVTFEDEPEPVT